MMFFVISNMDNINTNNKTSIFTRFTKEAIRYNAVCSFLKRTLKEVESSNVSDAAKSLYCEILSVCSQFNDYALLVCGRDAYQMVILELSDAGFLIDTQKDDPNQYPDVFFSHQSVLEPLGIAKIVQ
jgi:hypothetical protein